MGVFCTTVLLAFPQFIFQIFIDEEGVIPIGVDYLRILGVSQAFMCIEITTAGAFNGLGKSIPPSIVGVSLSAARIPLAIALGATLLEYDDYLSSGSMFRKLQLPMVIQT